MLLTEARLPAEWEAQQALLLTWPHGGDWTEKLEAIQSEYLELIDAIRAFQPVWLITPTDPDAQASIPAARNGLKTIAIPTDDTWCRDYGPVTLVNGPGRHAIDFHFNGWGGRFEARKDDRVNTLLARQPLFSTFTFEAVHLELEGGAIECDGQGSLLVNRHCLRLRAPHLTDADLDLELKALLRVERVLDIDIPPIPGDDTDGHIDTLARFAGTDSIVFQQPQEADLASELQRQLASLRTLSGNPYTLHALPIPKDLDPGLAASYANFILINGAVLVPRFGSRFDDTALEVLGTLFPNRKAVPVSAAALVTQGGGPHCASMQIPAAA